MMKRVKICLPSNPYEVRIGTKLLGYSLSQAMDWLFPESGKKVFLYTDENLKASHRQMTKTLTQAGWVVQGRLIQAGESLKSIKKIYPIYEELLKNSANRKTPLIVVGGGSLGDALGFVAGTFHRGMPWVNVPTTLLAQVDSALGGKTGINHEVGKNLIGVFHQPSLVVCDVSLLKKLEPRDRLSGFGEMVKYALAFDEKFYYFLKKNEKNILNLYSPLIEQAIFRCVKLKARVVEEDELDQKNIRETLNLGHTFAHAFEKVGDYGYFRHGEAVLWGLRAVLQLSEIRGYLPLSEVQKADDWLKTLKLPKIPLRLRAQQVLEAIGQDKKRTHGRVKFILLKKIGKCISDSNVSSHEIVESLRRIGIQK